MKSDLGVVLNTADGKTTFEVSHQDVWWVTQTKWYLVSNHRNAGYIARIVRNEDGTQSSVYLHREVLGLGKGARIDGQVACGDHLNEHTFDNRRSNLEAVTVAENSRRAMARRRARLDSSNLAKAA